MPLEAPVMRERCPSNDSSSSPSSSCCCPACASGLSSPSSAQRAIELDDRGQLLALQRGEIEFASKETALRIEHLEIAVETSLVPVGRQPSGIAQGRHELLLLCALLARLVVTGERVRDLAERPVDRALVVHDELSLDRFGEPDVSARASRIEDRRGRGGAHAPRTGGGGEQCREVAALNAQHTS